MIQKKSFRDVSKKLDESPQPRFTPSVSSADSFLKEEALWGAYLPKIKRNSAASHALTAEFSFNKRGRALRARYRNLCIISDLLIYCSFNMQPVFR